MNMPIDLVVTYLDDSDLTWIESYNAYRKQEIDQGIVEATNAQAFGIERIRNWDNMKYWFRGVENNCPWINKIFFIVQKESQIPEWLDTSNPKLKIIYHEDYIPRELLPTFNTMIIQSFIPLIKDLSELYIYTDDDNFFLNPIKSTMFFTSEGVPYHKSNSFWGQGTYAEKIGSWGKNLDNTYAIEKKYGGVNYKYAPYHLPNPQVKSINQKILKDNWNEIYDGLKVSKFRNKKNISPIELYSNITKRIGACEINNEMFSNSNYIGLDINTNFINYKNKDIVCFNDTEKTLDFEIIKQRFINFLENKFPNKSSFEKEK